MVMFYYSISSFDKPISYMYNSNSKILSAGVFCSCTHCICSDIISYTAIDEVEDYFNDYNTEYGHAADHRRAAKWSLFVAVMGIIFQSVMGLIQYLYLKSCVKSIFSTYAYLVSN